MNREWMMMGIVGILLFPLLLLSQYLKPELQGRSQSPGKVEQTNRELPT